jgi:2-haloacid dehalogenase
MAVSAAVAFGTASAGVVLAESRSKLKIKAVAFDAFPIFDSGPVFALADALFPGKGAELGNEWRARQFEYAWLRVAARHYVDFWQVTDDALVFSAAKLRLDLPEVKRAKLMNAYLALKTWSDVVPSLGALKQAGFRLALLSNLTQTMLDADIETAGLKGIFEQVLSTDRAKTFKPDPQAYQLGIDALGLKREEILFAAHAGWDAAGAKLFGYPTFWVNRQKLPMEQLGAIPDGEGDSLSHLVKYLE